MHEEQDREALNALLGWEERIAQIVKFKDRHARTSAIKKASIDLMSKLGALPNWGQIAIDVIAELRRRQLAADNTSQWRDSGIIDAVVREARRGLEPTLAAARAEAETARKANASNEAS